MFHFNIKMRALGCAILCSFLLSNASCVSDLNSANIPLSLSVPAGNPIDNAAGMRLTGVYSVLQGNETFGDTIVARWVKGELCLYAGEQAIFAETVGAIAGDTARFNGYYLFVRSAASGSMNLQILPGAGGSMLGNHSTDSQMVISG